MSTQGGCPTIHIAIRLPLGRLSDTVQGVYHFSHFVTSDNVLHSIL